MIKFKKILTAIDTWTDRFISKGGQNQFLEYFIKYLLTCGVGINLTFIILILISIFK